MVGTYSTHTHVQVYIHSLVYKNMSSTEFVKIKCPAQKTHFFTKTYVVDVLVQLLNDCSLTTSVSTLDSVEWRVDYLLGSSALQVYTHDMYRQCV